MTFATSLVASSFCARPVAQAFVAAGTSRTMSPIWKTAAMLVIAHRGASDAAPENTPEAFELADRMGADGVELDVRVRVDDAGIERLVVHHDPIPTEHGVAAALPSFDDVLDACGDRMLVNVEIKNDLGPARHDPSAAMVPPIVEAIRRRGASWVERVLISSFSDATIDRCREIAPEFATAALRELISSDDIERVAAAGHAAIHPWHPTATADVVERAHRAGLAVNVWTANEPADLTALATNGVDGACTDVPDVALAVLGRTADDRALSPRWARPA